MITYDPRGIGRSVRKDDRVDNRPEVQAEDLHALIQTLGGPVEIFASSGGSVTALALVTAYPDDVTTLVAHEPPLISVLPDAEAARRARDGFHDAYERGGSSAGMAAFIAMTSWRGEFTDEYFSQSPPDPRQFGLTSPDDGSRDDPLLSDRSWPINDYSLDIGRLTGSTTRVLIGVAEESADTFTARRRGRPRSFWAKTRSSSQAITVASLGQSSVSRVSRSHLRPSSEKSSTMVDRACRRSEIPRPPEHAGRDPGRRPHRESRGAHERVRRALETAGRTGRSGSPKRAPS